VLYVFGLTLKENKKIRWHELTGSFEGEKYTLCTISSLLVENISSIMYD